MSLFRHPHLTRGVVHTSKGGFVVKRGLVDVPDEVGEAYGWERMDSDDDSAVSATDRASESDRNRAGTR